MSESTYDLGAIFDEHVADEFAAKDVAATMATMTAEPFVNHVPTMMGGVGGAQVAGAIQAEKVLDKDIPANHLLNRTRR
ncbi:MAG TPA: hypothetical protein VH496_00810 [Mycobacterium sp.]|jgi:hypothetical protein